MMKIKGNIRGMVYASAIAAIYVVLTLVSAAAGLSGGVIQFRLSEALTVLRHKPGNGEMLYNIIFQTFITPDKPSHSEILYRLDISEHHYYRLRQQAVNILSIRLWTAPQGCLDAWFEILTLLEG